MSRLLLKLILTVMVVSLVYSSRVYTQEGPSTKKATRVRITQGPEIERADPDFVIIRWTSNNPGGSPEHYGVVRYGTGPTKLDQTAKSPIRLNPSHPYTIFRVRVNGLKPRTTYYYRVESMTADGKGDGVKSSVEHFTTPDGQEKDGQEKQESVSWSRPLVRQHSSERRGEAVVEHTSSLERMK